MSSSFHMVDIILYDDPFTWTLDIINQALGTVLATLITSNPNRALPKYANALINIALNGQSKEEKLGAIKTFASLFPSVNIIALDEFYYQNLDSMLKYTYGDMPYIPLLLGIDQSISGKNYILQLDEELNNTNNEWLKKLIANRIIYLIVYNVYLYNDREVEPIFNDIVNEYILFIYTRSGLNKSMLSVILNELFDVYQRQIREYRQYEVARLIIDWSMANPFIIQDPEFKDRLIKIYNSPSTIEHQLQSSETGQYIENVNMNMLEKRMREKEEEGEMMGIGEEEEGKRMVKRRELSYYF